MYATRNPNQFIHKDDEPNIVNGQEEHYRGNMLSMVLRIMTEGGQNPICLRNSSLAGCSTTGGGIGITKATQILFDTIQFYTPSTATWEHLAEYASEAAFDRYAQCDPYRNAAPEQATVDRAFGSIGYPRLTGAIQCY